MGPAEEIARRVRLAIVSPGLNGCDLRETLGELGALLAQVQDRRQFLADARQCGAAFADEIAELEVLNRDLPEFEAAFGELQALAEPLLAQILADTAAITQRPSNLH